MSEDPKQQAADALFGKVAELAPTTEDVPSLKQLADTYAQVAFGPQGGDITKEEETRSESKTESRTESSAKSTSSHTSDYHETHHPNGEPKHPPGFSERQD